MKVLLTGGTGTLGTELQRIAKAGVHDLVAPSSKEMDITNFEQVLEFSKSEKPDIILHAAAYTDVKMADADLEKVLDVNVVGTCNLVKASCDLQLRFVFISTDHVFDGETGFYKPDDPINPVTTYAKSKAAAELAARMYDGSLIIRTSFFSYNFPYDRAFTDQWSSKDYVDVIAPMVLELAVSDNLGIAHCVSERRTLYEIAQERSPNVGKMLRKDIDFPIPKDTSLI